MAFVDLEECPHCSTSKALKPDLEFLYSDCCGSHICRQCLFEVFEKQRLYRCADCGKNLTSKNFKAGNLIEQKAKKVLNCRTKVNAVMNLRRDDFESDIEWNDYLELIEDVIWDLAHGNAALRESANRKLKEFEVRHKELISKNRAMDIEAERRKRQKPIVEEHIEETLSEKPEMPWLQNHPVYKDYRGPQVLDTVDSPVVPEDMDVKALRYLRWRAGGFTEDIWKKRGRMTVKSGMSWFSSDQSSKTTSMTSGS